MKATYLTATIISLMQAMPCGAATSELETLRQRCQQQEQRIDQLERQLKQLGARPAEQAKAPGESPAPAESAGGRTYTVRAGDNVDKIARRNGCTVAALNSLNNLREKAVIFPGQTLKLPEKSRSAPTETARAVEAPAPAKEAARTHTIQQGETYTSISRKYKIPVNSLVALNPEVKATALRPGLKIRLSQPKSDTPAKSDDLAVAKTASPKHGAPTTAKEEEAKPRERVGTKSDATPAKAEPSTGESPSLRATAAQAVHAEKPKAETAQPPSTASEPTPTAKEPAPPVVEADPKPGKRIRPVKIEEPMTYGEFASKHGTTADRLNDLNGLDLTQATVLAKGSELYVPAQP